MRLNIFILLGGIGVFGTLAAVFDAAPQQSVFFAGMTVLCVVLLATIFPMKAKWFL